MDACILPSRFHHNGCGTEPRPASESSCGQYACRPLFSKGVNIDTNYITRPTTKWTVVARLNVSGAKIESEGTDNGNHFKSEMKADYKSTLSLAVSYLGISLSASLNPAKLMGKYSDYELNFNSYGKRFGFDIIYQNAHNFTGWHDTDGMERIELPEEMLSVKTLNVNAYYAFNSSRFSYPAAFSKATSSASRPVASCWPFQVRGSTPSSANGLIWDGRRR